MNSRVIASILLVLGGASCSNDGPTPNGSNNPGTSGGEAEYFLGFPELEVEGGTTGGEPPPIFGVCELTAPGDTLALIRVESAQHETYSDCNDEPDYYLEHFVVDGTRLAGEPALADREFRTYWIGEYDTLSPRPRQGQIYLISMRKDEGKWFVTQYVPVNASPDAAPGPLAAETIFDYRIPDTWGSVVAAAGPIRADYVGSCGTEFRNHDWARTKEMSDSEFHEFIHQPMRRSWCDDNQVDADMGHEPDMTP